MTVDTSKGETNLHIFKPLQFGGFPGKAGEESIYQCRTHERWGFSPWVRKIPRWRKWQPTPVFLPGKFHEQRRLVGYSLWGHKELDMSKHVHTHIVISLLASSRTQMFSIPPEITEKCKWKESKSKLCNKTALCHKSMLNYKNVILKHWHFKKMIVLKNHGIAKLFSKLLSR